MANNMSVPDLLARLRDVARLLRRAPNLDDDARAAIGELVDELTNVLQSSTLLPAEVALLAETTTHLAESLHHQHDERAVGKARERFEQAVVNAESHAPTVVGLARRLIETLANIGI